jgi:hypothetical protein
MLRSSECLPGCEQYEKFTCVTRRKRKTYVQYDYRYYNGELFSCVDMTVTKCREQRDNWLKEKGRLDEKDGQILWINEGGK